MFRRALAIAVVVLAMCPAQAQVALREFVAGERARAADVNGNFASLKAAVEAAQQENATLRTQVAELQTALATLISLRDALSVETVNGTRTLRLSGINLQVVNGTNDTETVNGSGNLIIGYDEPNTGARAMCTLATDTNGNPLTTDATCQAAGGRVIARVKSGSHNLVMGTQNSYSSAAGIVAGRGNYVTALYASNLGGNDNIAFGSLAVNVAGQNNHAVGVSSATLAGANNMATGQTSSIAGGAANTATSVNATVSGGFRGLASGPNSNVSGGIRNEASGAFSHVSGGGNNVSSGTTSTVAGGGGNDAQAPTSSISGGSNLVTTAVTQVLP